MITARQINIKSDNGAISINAKLVSDADYYTQEFGKAYKGSHWEIKLSDPKCLISCSSAAYDAIHHTSKAAIITMAHESNQFKDALKNIDVQKYVADYYRELAKRNEEREVAIYGQAYVDYVKEFDKQMFAERKSAKK